MPANGFNALALEKRLEAILRFLHVNLEGHDFPTFSLMLLAAAFFAVDGLIPEAANAQSHNPMGNGYVQDHNPMGSGYVQDKGVLGF